MTTRSGRRPDCFTYWDDGDPDCYEECAIKVVEEFLEERHRD